MTDIEVKNYIMTQKVSKTSVKASLFTFRRLVLALVFLFAAQGVWGADYYWVGGTEDHENDWNTLTNWALSDGGEGGDGITDFPGNSDKVFFTTDAQITADTAVTVGEIEISELKTVTINASLSSTIITNAGISCHSTTMLL